MAMAWAAAGIAICPSAVFAMEAVRTSTSVSPRTAPLLEESGPVNCGSLCCVIDLTLRCDFRHRFTLIRM